MHTRHFIILLNLWLLAFNIAGQTNPDTFVIAAYNVENWLAMERNHKADKPKPASQRTNVFDIVAHIKPDVLGLEEIGTVKDLAELADGLQARGLSFPYRELVQGADPTRHVALLSRFPITRRRPHTTDTYTVNGKTLHVSRGFLDVEIHVNDHYWFRALVAHLKSKRQVDFADEAVLRREEARLLRQHIDQTLKRDPNINLIAMGDFNDTPDSEPIRAVLRPDPFQLFALPAVDSTGGEGTHYWWKERSFSRIDYLIASPGMSNEFVTGSAHVADPPHWQRASDHRAIYASFLAHDIGPIPLLPSAMPEWLVPVLIGSLLLLLISAGVLIVLLRRTQPTTAR